MSTIPDTTHAAPATAAADAREKRLEETVGALIRRSVVSRVDRNMEEWKAWMLATQLIARMRELSGSAGGTDTADPRWREAFHMLSLQSNLSSVEAHFVARVTLSLVRSAATSVQPIDERVPSGDIGELSNTHEFATAFKTLAQDSFVRSLRHFFMQETEAGMRDPRTGEDDELSETIAGIADDLIGRDTGYLSGRLHLGFLRGIANACAKAETEAEKHAIVMARLRTRKEWQIGQDEMAAMWVTLNQAGLDERRSTAFVTFAFAYLDDIFAGCVMRYNGHLREASKTA